MSWPARLYLLAVCLVGLGATAPLLAGISWHTGEWATFGFLAVGAAIGSIIIVPTERNHGFHTGLLFLAAGALLLPGPLVALIGIAQQCPWLIGRRYPWYIQAFNLSNFTLNAIVGWAVAHAIVDHAPASTALSFALAAAAACGSMVLVNHALLAGALRLARGIGFRESGLFGVQSVSTDLVLCALGAVIALVWREDAYLVPLALAPLALMNRSFSLLAQLQRSERRFRAVFDATAMGIRLTDTSGRLLGQNRAFEQMLGYSDGELEDMTLEELAYPDDVAAHRRVLAELVEGKRDEYQIEERYLRKDGSVVWAHLTGSLVRDADGNGEFAIGMAHDITDRKRLEEQLNQAQKLEAIGRLAGGIAHDFNNLLTVITSYSGFVLQALGPENERLRDDVEAIEQASHKAGELTRQLLAFGRKQILQPEILDLNTLVADTYKMLRRLIGEDIEVTTSFSSGLGRVKADPGQMEQVLVNLGLNARDAMPAGGTLTIQTANLSAADAQAADLPGADGGYVVLSVADTGVGMDEHTRTHMFEPFFTTKSASGNGLGLASVYGIVAQSGGRIDVASAPGRGTTVRVYLPAVEEEEASMAAPLAAVQGGAETVLVVEDEDRVRVAARRMLAQCGYNVLEAFDGNDALELSARYPGPIDLVVTDVVMPRMSGRELVDRLLLDRPKLRVLFMSGYTDETVVPLGVPARTTGLIQKPFTAESLAGRVRDLLDMAEPAQREPLVADRRASGARSRR